MSIGSVSVDVVPDATGFAEKLRAKLRDVNVNVGVNLDDTKVRAQLDKLGASSRTVKINANVDDGGARVKLRDLIRRRQTTVTVDAKTALADARVSAFASKERRLQVKADLDTKLAQARLDKLTRPRTVPVRARVDGSRSAADAAGSMGLLVKSAILLGPALIPATAAVVGLAGALAAPALIAGAGAGIFGLVATGAIAKAVKDEKAIAAIRKKADSATDPKKQALLTKQANQALAALPKSERTFLKAKGAISAGFDELLKKSGKNIFGPLTAGSTLLAKILPKLSPVTNAFGHAITGMINQFSRFSDTAGFRSGIDFLATTGVHAFKQLVTISGNVAVGIGGMIRAFAPMGTTVLSSIGALTRKFADFGRHAGSNSGLQSFFAYVRSVGPKLAQTIRDVARAVGRVVTALAPQGSTMLGVIGALARTVSKLKPGQIAAIAGAVGALGLATGKFGKLTSLTLLVSALSYAYRHSSAFRTLADDAGRLAGALNSLPKGLKIGLGVAAGALALKGGTGGAVGNVVSKVIGGGVQKVFVVNPGFGAAGGGLPTAVGGKTPTVIPTGVPKTGIFGGGAVKGLLALLSVLPAAGAVGNDQPKNPIKMTGMSANVFKFAGVANPGTIQGLAKGMETLDSNAAKLAKTNPGQTLTALQTRAKAAGIPLSMLNEQLPKTHAILGDLGETTKGMAGPLAKVTALQLRLGLAALRSGTGFASAGLKAGEYRNKLLTLPQGVQTKITTPGAVTSREDVLKLKKQYDLTPVQVRTLMQLVGANAATAAVDRLRKAYRLTPRQVKTIVSQAGAHPTLATITALAEKYHLTPKQVRTLLVATDLASGKADKAKQAGAKFAKAYQASLKAHDGASGVITPTQRKAVKFAKAYLAQLKATNSTGPGVAAARRLIAGLHDKTVRINAYYTRFNKIVNQGPGKKGQPPNQVVSPSGATGGWLRGAGTGTSDSINLWGSDGEFLVNAAAAARNAALLEGINGGKGTGGNRMAAGGTVTSSSVGSNVFHLYDADGTLMATMRGVADGTFKGAQAHAAGLARMSRG